jgi:peptidoglycan/xylan/chitin deacetylase (PgdA/CDA1 family)
MRSSFFIFIILFSISCTAKKNEVKDINVPPSKARHDSIEPAAMVNAATILSKRQVPVLCYHHIRNTSLGDYTVSPEFFAEQMQALADSGYKTILPDQLYNYLTGGDSIPQKAILITFDDTDLEQFTIGFPEMNKHGFKGVYFIMTVAIGRKRYMSKEQIKQLADDGNFIEAHTWNHSKVTEYNDADWDKQLNEAKKKLETITGRPILYFAYPFGLWDKAAIQELQHRGIKMAFQLSAKPDSIQPLYTVRRMLIPGTWTTKGLFKAIKRTFHL